MTHDDEIARLRAQLGPAMVAELEALLGAPLADAFEAAAKRAEVGQPYGLMDVLESVRGAFHKMAVDRNMWRARAKRATK